MRGRHSEVEDAGREVAPQLWHAALAAAPVTAVLAAVGAGAAGYLTHSPELAAVGALAGAAGAAAESARTRSSRVRARDERAALREEIRMLAAAVQKLSNEINARPAVLHAEPLPAFALAPGAGAAMPMVATFARAAEPATPRSLPILTANRRGLQSSRPPLPARATPTVTALLAPAAVTPLLAPAATATAAIARLVAETPRRVDADDDRPTTRIPRLTTAPAHWTPAEPLPSHVLPPRDPAPRLILGGDHSALPMPRPPATPISGLVLPSLRPGPSASRSELRVIDLRSSTRTMAGALSGTRAGTVTQDGPAEPVSLFEPVRRLGSGHVSETALAVPVHLAPEVPETPASLFEPRPRAGRPGAVPGPPDPGAADGARHAWRGMRPGVPPSPFFTPGAFEGSPHGA